MNKRLLIVGVVLIAVAFLGVMIVLSQKSPEAAKVLSVSVQQLYDEAVALENKNELLAAKEAYQKILAEHPDFKDIAQLQKRLEGVNLKIIISAVETPKTVTHEVRVGDSLGKIAKQYNTTVELIKKSNGLAGDIIKVGQRLRIWQGTFSVFVDKSQNILILKSDDEVVKVYPVATGKNNITPVGTFKIVDKLVNPVWFKSGAIVPPDSPENILGSRWLGFDIPGYGIHGTTDPASIGQQITAGCVRMHNEDVEELYSLLPVGTQVTIVD